MRTAARGAAYAAFVVALMVWFVGPDKFLVPNAIIANGHFPGVRAPFSDPAQIMYFLWLWIDALLTLDHLPWVDPYQFAATGHVSQQPFGWPLIVVFAPFYALGGPSLGYNAVFVGSFLASAFGAYLFVRELGSTRAGAAVAGIAFAFAPFRVWQAIGHFNGFLAFLLPFTLLFIERAIRSTDERQARRAGWVAGIFLLSIVGSGELHLAVFGLALSGAYALVRGWGTPRRRIRVLALPVAFTALAGFAIVIPLALLVRRAYPSGRSSEEAARYAPRLSNLIARSTDVPNFEHYSYVGTAIAALALAGIAVALWKRDRVRVAVFFVVMAVGSSVAAVLPGLDSPLATLVHQIVIPLRFSRVPGRVMIVAALALAFITALAIDAIRGRRLRWSVAVLAMILVVADAPRSIYRLQYTDYAPYVEVPRGASILDLPPFHPHSQFSAVYEFEIMTHPGPRTGGYNVFARPQVIDAVTSLAPLTQVPVDPCEWHRASGRIDVDHVAVHTELYGPSPLWDGVSPRELMRSLERTRGFERVSLVDGVAVYRFTPELLACEG